MLRLLTARVAQFRADRRGVTTIEYGLIAALIAVVIIHSLIGVGHDMANTFAAVASEL